MMKNKNHSRTTNSIYNFTSSIGGQLLTIVMQFAVRTAFIEHLGKAYLGINGLFSNILSMLSLAEFGVGSAILFKLYDPIAKNDHKRITLLMKFYKSVYRIIGIVIACIGVSLIPFLPYLIKDYDTLEALNLNATVVFVLYLLNTVSSYFFFAYRSAIINANQKEYIINIIGYFFTFITGIVQIICLLLIPSFELYVCILVMQVILQNIVIAVVSSKMYPYIKKKTTEKIPVTEVKDVFKDCSALFLYKLNGVVLKATDNIVLSVFLGLEHVAMYSNYYVLYTTINTLFAKIYNSISHSLGNLHTSQNLKHEYKVFETVNLITAIIGGTAGVGIFVVSNAFVNEWIGHEWVLQQPFALLMGLEIYTLAFRIALSKYRTTMGLFQQAKFRPLAGMIINIIVSVMLVENLGICGIIVGTLVADWTTLLWYDPLIIHKHGFKNYCSAFVYYKKFLKYFIYVWIVGIINYVFCSNIFVGHGWFSVILYAIICVITVPGVLIVINYKTPEGKYVLSILKRYYNIVLKKIKG